MIAVPSGFFVARGGPRKAVGAATAPSNRVEGTATTGVAPGSIQGLCPSWTQGLPLNVSQLSGDPAW